MMAFQIKLFKVNAVSYTHLFQKFRELCENIKVIRKIVCRYYGDGSDDNENFENGYKRIYEVYEKSFKNLSLIHIFNQLCECLKLEEGNLVYIWLKNIIYFFNETNISPETKEIYEKFKEKMCIRDSAIT